MDLHETFNFLPIKKWRHFRSPFPSRDSFECYFRDGQPKRLIPVLGHSVLIGFFWNHNVVLQRKRRRHSSLGERSRPESAPDSIGPALERPLQGEDQVVLQRNGISNASLDDLTRSGTKRLAHLSYPFFSQDTFYLIGCILQLLMYITQVHSNSLMP